MWVIGISGLGEHSQIYTGLLVSRDSFYFFAIISSLDRAKLLVLALDRKVTSLVHFFNSKWRTRKKVEKPVIVAIPTFVICHREGRGFEGRRLKFESSSPLGKL